eukprot:Opistho-2@61636
MEEVPNGQRALDVLGGEGACPPEDSNGSEIYCAGMWYQAGTRQSVDATPGDPQFQVFVDCLFFDKSGNDMYAAAVAPGGVLVNKAKQGHSRAHDDIVSNASYYKPPYVQLALLNGRFRPDFFNLDEAQRRVAAHLSTRLSSGAAACCPCCDGVGTEKSIKKLDLCASCGAAATPDVRLKSRSACKAVRYCGGQCQKNHWAVHKAICPQLKVEMEAALASGRGQT